MQILFFFVILSLVVLMVAGVAKLSVYLSRTGTLSWKHGLFFAGCLFTLTMVVKVISHFVPGLDTVHPLLRAAGGLAMSTGFAAFFFSHHVVKPDGATATSGDGVKAGAVYAGMILLLMVPLALIAP